MDDEVETAAPKKTKAPKSGGRTQEDAEREGGGKKVNTNL